MEIFCIFQGRFSKRGVKSTIICTQQVLEASKRVTEAIKIGTISNWSVRWKYGNICKPSGLLSVHLTICPVSPLVPSICTPVSGLTHQQTLLPGWHCWRVNLPSLVHFGTYTRGEALPFANKLDLFISQMLSMRNLKMKYSNWYFFFTNFSNYTF